ncbi:RrF2 family transcriptional regulator [Ulvibacter antarcticus]|uniref:BadM/Rrf2 family transcriptional regulator n=1 Tax=Ulvibacter antarcticus TaxID=442714 RepID=A0A3L9YRU6_9FLAO|nr:Rrf2 family transcriptional regulator [Ulvibacter antarcticus]RMA57212.1 BadM/Rrf2 family transcriptional regulator [Ulvibacter antarcticus]
MLSRKTKYGLKALSYLARNQDDAPVQISVISNAENISLKFLESILLTLKKAGFLGSKKGKGGGYYLLREAEKISIASVYRVLEGPIALVPCVSLNFYEKCDDCPDEDLCSVHNLMIDVRDSNLKILENTTLSDLIKDHEEV